MSLWVVDYSLNAQFVCLTQKIQDCDHTGWVVRRSNSCWCYTEYVNVIQPWEVFFVTPVLICTESYSCGKMTLSVLFVCMHRVPFTLLVFEVLHKVTSVVRIRVQQRKNPEKHGYIVVRYNSEILYLTFLNSDNHLFSNEMNIFYCIQFRETLIYQNSLILANSKDIWQCTPIYLYDIIGNLSFNKSNWILFNFSQARGRGEEEGRAGQSRTEQGRTGGWSFFWHKHCRCSWSPLGGRLATK